MTAKVGVPIPVHAIDDLDVKWLCAAIESVLGQSFEDLEIRVVNDHSKVEFKDYVDLKQLFKETRLTGVRASVPGVSNARNLAVEGLDAELILPLDHDDLFPEGAIQKFLDNWPGEGLVHGDTLLMQENSQRIFPGRPYDFNVLMQQLYLPIGSLHLKSDWEKVGGWKPTMDDGLEDWEYWIALGELGVCGTYVPEVLYTYRRHARGRLAKLRTTPEAFTTAQAQIRELHLDTFNGRKPMGCCGGGSSAPAPQGLGFQPGPDPIQLMQQTASPALIPIMYVGNMTGTTYITGRASGIRYAVRGPNELLQMPDGRLGVAPQDERFILGQDRGVSFRRQ